MSTTARLIGQDSAVKIAMGGVAKGLPPVFGAAVQFIGLCKRAMLTEEVRDTDVSALGDPLEKKRVKRSAATVEIELFISAQNGRAFNGAVGYAVKASIAETGATGGNFTDYVGYIGKVEYDDPDDPQTEKLTIPIALDGYVYGTTGQSYS